MAIRRTAILRLLTAASLGLFVTCSYASVDTPFVGGVGGKLFDIRCPDDAVLAGMGISGGNLLDSIDARCVSVQSDGRWLGEPWREGERVGGSGGTFNLSVCPRDHAVTGFVASPGYGTYDYLAGHVRLRCAPLVAADRTGGERVVLGGYGRLVESARAQHECADDRPAVGLYGGAGYRVDRYGLRCAGGPVPVPESRWSGIADWPLIGVHAVLLPDGDVLSYGTNDRGVQGAQMFYDVWDPEAGTGAGSHYTLDNSLGVDSFCSAPLVMASSGDVLMPGGDARFGSGVNKGIVDAPIFRTGTRTLERASDMHQARWYPTATTLADGDILLVGGIDGEGKPSIVPEIYSVRDDAWRQLFGAASDEVFGDREERWFYPRQWVAPDGRVFGMTGTAMYYLDPRGNGSIEIVGKVPNNSRGHRSTSVMYRPGKILQVGGWGRRGAIVVDINGATPTVRSVAPMNFDRLSWANASVLPNGEVLVTGGGSTDNTIDGAVMTAELWNPDTERFVALSEGQLARLYHSTSLLLPDGRLLVGGGGAPGPVNNTNAEFFTPPYLLEDSGALRERPRISSAPSSAGFGSRLDLQVRSAAPIAGVSIVRTGSVTHSVNLEQRYMALPHEVTGDTVRLTVPEDRNRLPPGHYLLFVLDDRGTPSEGHIVRIGDDADQEVDEEVDEKVVEEPAAEPITTARTATVGGEGGEPFEVDCGADHVLAGLRVRAGVAIDAVSAQCVAVDGEGRWSGAPVERGGAHGGGGGRESLALCPRDTAVVGFTGSNGLWPFGGQVGHLQLHCAALQSATASGGSRASSEARGRPVVVATREDAVCAGARPARGIVGASGKYLDAFGLLCMTSDDEKVDEEPVAEPITTARTATVGGEGGEPFEVDCGADHVLVGLQVRAGVAIDAVSAQCVAVDGEGRWSGAPVERGGAHGGGGGRESLALCPRDTAVVGFTGSNGLWPFGAKVGHLQLHCAALQSATASGGSRASSEARGRPVVAATREDAVCAGARPARGIVGASGKYLDAFGLLCMAS